MGIDPRTIRLRITLEYDSPDARSRLIDAVRSKGVASVVDELWPNDSLRKYVERALELIARSDT